MHRMPSVRSALVSSTRVAVLCGLLPLLAVVAQAQSAPADPLASVHWRFIGPIGNRAIAVAGVPGDPMVTYLGAAAGGIWKTVNGGVDWKPIFDKEEVSAVGALALAPSEPTVVWAGTGETFVIRPFYPMGDGVYKSIDGGEHWEHMGLENTGHIGRIVIDPNDAQTVYVCSAGQFFKPATDGGGIFRTTDGGKNWTQVLKLDEKTGCSDLAIDPKNPGTLVAGMWPVLIHPWAIDAGGPQGGVYITHDGGANWKKAVGHGMPDHPVAKVAVAIAQSNPKRVYALVQEDQPALYRSDDGGESWTMVSHDHLMMQRDSYYVRFGVSTTDPDRLYFVSPNYVVSEDGGKTFSEPGKDGFASSGGDNHDVWIDPLNSQRIMVANDAGISISLDGSHSFEHIRLPISQVYHVTVDDQIPYKIYGNLQDATSFVGPSNTLAAGYGGGGMIAADFTDIGGCESGFATPEPGDPNIIWSGCFQGIITRINLRDGQARDVSAWPDVFDGWAGKDVKERWHWTIPLTISPYDPKHVYIGSQSVHETKDGGQTWKTISPDLTLNKKEYQGDSGGLSIDNLYTFDASVLYAIAESPVKQGVIWAGTNDGQVQLTQDGGGHWTNLTKNIAGMAPMGTIWSIAASPFDAATAYITVNLEQMGDYNAYVYKTSDYGKSWKMISGGIPKSVNNSAHCVLEDPVRKGMLYLGTDNAIYVTWDDGGHWTKLNENLPPAPVYWMTVQKTFNDLVISTYGRGDWILDDVTALREFDKAQAGGVTHLYTPRDAYRFRTVTARPLQEPGARIIGQNPPYGADINFYVASDTKATLTFSGADGKTIRRLTADAKSGMNRVWWDLRGENGAMPHMLVSPVDASWYQNGPKGYHILTGVMIGNSIRGPLVLPGKYTVKLTVGGQTLTAPLTVLLDPHTQGTLQTLEAEKKFETELVGEINQTSDMIEHLEWVRKQVESLQMRYGGDAAQKPVLDAAKALADRAIGIEGKLMDVYLTDGNEDLNRHPSQLYQKLAALLSKDEADLGPTGPQLEVNEYYKQWLVQSKSSLQEFEAKDVPAFNAMLKAHNLLLAIQP
jgi:photosystem II stability/assembly factor-like uncharacterized protein